MRSSKTFYFLFFAAGAALIPFLTLHYQALGLTGQQIGFLTGIAPLITLVAAPAWGAAADATHKHHLLLLVAIGGLWLSIFALSRATTFTALIPIVCLYAIFFAPIVPLVDNSVITNLGARKGEYGRIRVWGSYGWGIAAAVIGIIIQQSGLSWTFTVYLLLTMALLLVGIRLPVRSISMRGTVWQGIRVLLGNGRWLLFLAVALVEGMSLGIFLNYLFLHLREMGASGTIMGLSLTIATASEIPIFLYSRKLLTRWGTPALLAISLGGTIVRAFAYAAMSAPWQVLPISLLHGPTFAVMWTAGVAYADELAPPGLGATAQGMFSSAVFGLGAGLGAFSGGILYDAYGGAVTFQWIGWVAMATLFIFIWANRSAFKSPLPKSPNPLN
ncbi:MAG: MFS transporter [Chloroflexi bacterium]|nr:MFS transporter [Chloroflexota bacterium]